MDHLINTVEKLKDAIGHLKGCPRLSHDTETTGKYPFYGDRTFSYIFSDSVDNFYIDLNIGGIKKRKAIPIISELFEDEARQFVYCNAVFDLNMMYFDGIKNPKGRFIDIPALARVEYNQHEGSGRNNDGESFLSMDYLAKWYLKTQKDDRVKKYIAENNLYCTHHFTGEKSPMYNRVPLDIMFKYGCSDGRITFDLAKEVLQRINRKDGLYNHNTKMINVAKNEIEFTKVLNNIKITGFPIDREYIERASLAEKEIEKKLSLEVKEILGDINIKSTKQLGIFLETKGVEVPRKPLTKFANTRVSKKKEKIFLLLEKKPKNFEKKITNLDIEIKEILKGNYSLDAKTMFKLADKYDLPILSKIVGAKRANKKWNTYYDNFLAMADLDDVLHCGVSQETTITGRCSSHTPNLQNLHKEKFNGDENELLIRSSFIGFPNGRLFFVDYKQQEMIVMLDQAGEMGVISKLLNGEYQDFYLATAAVIKEITGLEITRGQAKAIALGLAYGQGKALLAKNLGVSLKEAEKIINAFFKALPKLKLFRDNLMSSAKRTGRIHNPFGRVYYTEKGYEYKALNSYVQGTSADITKTAMVSIDKELEKFESKMLLPVHDELIFWVKFGEEKEVLKIIRNKMRAAYPHKHIGLDVDFEVSELDSKGLSRWGHKVEYTYVT